MISAIFSDGSASNIQWNQATEVQIFLSPVSAFWFQLRLFVQKIANTEPRRGLGCIKAVDLVWLTYFTVRCRSSNADKCARRHRLISIRKFQMIHSAKPQKLPADIRIDRDLVYARTDKHQLRLDLYWHPEATRPMPLIIWVHGGAWRNGTKDVPSWVTSFCQGGYAVASVEYRLSHQAIFPAQIEDCKSAVR